MLILTRKKEEAIKIGDDITIRVLGIQGGNVKLGIKAPKSKTEVQLKKEKKSKNTKRKGGSMRKIQKGETQENFNKTTRSCTLKQLCYMQCSI